MKSITVNNRELHYDICVSGGEYSDYYYTKFYEGTVTTYRKKYYLFGEVIPIVKPKYLFDIWLNIESPSVPQKECKDKIIKALKSYDEKQKRFEQIKNGQII